jgi:hypothetical protein
MPKGFPNHGGINALAKASLDKSEATGTGPLAYCNECKHAGGCSHTGRTPCRLGQVRRVVSQQGISCGHRGRAPNGKNDPEARLAKEALRQPDRDDDQQCDCDQLKGPWTETVLDEFGVLQQVQVHGQQFTVGETCPDRAGHHNWKLVYWVDAAGKECCGEFLGHKLVTRSVLTSDSS